MRLVERLNEVTAQHELENPNTDVVEAIVVLSGRWMSVSDVQSKCVILNYEAVRQALMKLAGNGRLICEQQPNNRSRGPKIIGKYKGRPGQKARLFT